MHCAVECVGIDIFKIEFVFGIFVLNLPFRIKLNEFVFVALVFDQYGVGLLILICEQKLGIWAVTPTSSTFAKVIVQSVINLVIKSFLLKLVIQFVGF